MSRTSFPFSVIYLLVIHVVIFVFIIANLKEEDAQNRTMQLRPSRKLWLGFGAFGHHHMTENESERDDDNTIDHFSHDDTAGDRSNMIYCVGGSDGTEEFVYHFSNFKKAEDDFKFYSKELQFSVILRKLDESPPKTIRRFGEFKDLAVIEYFCETEQ